MPVSLLTSGMLRKLRGLGRGILIEKKLLTPLQFLRLHGGISHVANHQLLCTSFTSCMLLN